MKSEKGVWRNLWIYSQLVRTISVTSWCFPLALKSRQGGGDRSSLLGLSADLVGSGANSRQIVSQLKRILEHTADVWEFTAGVRKHHRMTSAEAEKCSLSLNQTKLMVECWQKGISIYIPSEDMTHCFLLNGRRKIWAPKMEKEGSKVRKTSLAIPASFR